MRILVLNAGSSSLKTSVIEQPGDATVSEAELQQPAHAGWTAALHDALGGADGADAIGHRVVHGGSRYTDPLLLSDTVVVALRALGDLAPLHNRPALDVMGASREAFPDLPQVACFDTAFHATLAPAAYVYPLPYEWHRDWGLRRFGFHGLSVTWSVERAAALLERDSANLGIVVAHLGSGCSVTAVEDGASLDTSMGMTPLEGMMMATRSGSVDPGLLLELLEDGRQSLVELRESLQHRSGLLGVSGISADLRKVEEAAVAGDGRATLAVEIFVRRAAAAIAAAATSLRTLDAIVFTGGIGEHATAVRSAICARLGIISIPATLRAPAGREDAILSPTGSRVAVLRVHAREDVVIARATAGLLA